MKFNKKWVGCIAVALVLIVSGCAPKEAEEAAPIKIGMPVPMTGAYASDGEEFLWGAALAVDEINAKGGLLGKQLLIIPGDYGEWDIGKFIAAVEKFVHRDKVDVVITGYGATPGDIDAMGQYEIPYIHADTDWVAAERMQELMPECSNVFMIDTHTLMYGPISAEFFNNTLVGEGVQYPNKKAAYIAAEDVWARSVTESQRDSMEKMGWETAAFEIALSGVVEWKTTIAKVKATNPSVLFFANLAPRSCAAFLTQLHELPIDAIVFLVYTPAMPEFMDLAGAHANGIVWTTVIAPLPGPKNDAFISKFEENYGRKPGFSLASGCYDMVYIWANAAEEVGDEKDYPAVCKAIEQSSYEGICGKYVFELETHWGVCGADEVPAHMYQIQNEEYVLIWPDNYATGEWELPDWLSSSWR